MNVLRARLPPSKSLLAFEAAARLGSFTKAAIALGVTPGAITQQINRLEEFTGVKLFQPHGRGRALTIPGQQLQESVSVGLGHICGAVEQIRQQELPTTLTVATSLSFASLWMIPRISSFRLRHPDITLRFITADADLDPEAEGLRLAVRYGDGAWPNLRVTHLHQPRLFPVCSPAYLTSCGTIKSIRDVPRHSLLDREPQLGRSFRIGWEDWLKRVDASLGAPRDRMYFSSYEVVIHSCIAGQGLALGVDVLVADLVRQGLLVCPLERGVMWPDSYYIVSPKSEPLTRAMKLFSDWLLEMACDPLVDVGPAVLKSDDLS